MSNTQWWYVMRSSGMVAWVLLMITVSWGALMASSWWRTGRRWLHDMHPFLATLGVAMLVLHIVAAVMDSDAGVSLLATVVPFTSSWNPVGVSLGVIALWAVGAVQVTSWMKRRLQRRTWNLVHQSSYVAAWAMALHALTAGTDAGRPWFAIGAGLLVVVTSAVTVRRALRAGRDEPRVERPTVRAA